MEMQQEVDVLGKWRMMSCCASFSLYAFSVNQDFSAIGEDEERLAAAVLAADAGREETSTKKGRRMMWLEEKQPLIFIFLRCRGHCSP